MLLAKLGQWTGLQTGSGAIVYKISDNITNHASSLVQMLEEDIAAPAPRCCRLQGLDYPR